MTSHLFEDGILRFMLRRKRTVILATAHLHLLKFAHKVEDRHCIFFLLPVHSHCEQGLTNINNFVHFTRQYVNLYIVVFSPCMIYYGIHVFFSSTEITGCDTYFH